MYASAVPVLALAFSPVSDSSATSNGRVKARSRLEIRVSEFTHSLDDTRGRGGGTLDDTQHLE